MINEFVLISKLIQVKLYLETLQEGNNIKPAGQPDFENCYEVTEEALELLNPGSQVQEGAAS